MSDTNKKNAAVGKMFFIILALFIAGVTYANIKTADGGDHKNCIEQQAGQHASVADKADAAERCTKQGR